MIGLNVSAQEVTFDFTYAEDDLTTNPWGLPTSYVKDAATYTNAGYTISFGESDNGHKQNKGYLIFGKQNATLSLPAFSFDVERIDIIGRDGASGSVKQNIFVGDEAICTETTGATGTNNYAIPEGKQAAGTIYTLKVLSNHNTQITQILIWKKGTSGDTPEPTHIANTAETAYTVAKAFELIDAGEALSETVFVKGIVSQVDSYNDTYKSITYWISDDGTTTKQLEVYSGKGLEGADFASVDDVKVGATVIVKGVLKKYKETYEFDKNNQLVSYSSDSQAQGVAWDFTVLPTQKIDNETANMETNAPDGTFTEDEGAGWQQAFNKADFPDGAEFKVNATDVFIPFKGLKWTAMASKQTVFYRNYPAEYGGKHLAFNKEAEFMLPAKKGEKIEMLVATSKKGGTTKKITSQDVEETFDEGTGGIKIEFTEAYVYQPVVLTVKVDNPYLKFESTFCVQKIEVKDASGINTLNANAKVYNGAIYNLAGQMVTSSYKGLVIMNGKKMIQK